MTSPAPFLRSWEIFNSKRSDWLHKKKRTLHLFPWWSLDASSSLSTIGFQKKKHGPLAVTFSCCLPYMWCFLIKKKNNIFNILSSSFQLDLKNVEVSSSSIEADTLHHRGSVLNWHRGVDPLTPPENANSLYMDCVCVRACVCGCLCVCWWAEESWQQTRGFFCLESSSSFSS